MGHKHGADTHVGLGLHG